MLIDLVVILTKKNWSRLVSIRLMLRLISLSLKTQDKCDEICFKKSVFPISAAGPLLSAVFF